MPLEPAVEELAEQLLTLYRDAQQHLDDLARAAATDPSRSAVYRSRLAGMARAIDEVLADLDTAAHGWVSEQLADVYQLGATRAAGDIGRQFSWNQVHREAAQELARDTYQDLLAATRYVRRDVKAFIRYAVREHARIVILEGETATRAARQLAARLEARGISAVTYRNGARHSLADYSDTAVRTKTALAYSGGQLNVGRQYGIEWVQVFDGADCGWETHDSSDRANGSVRTREEAEAHPIAHPRCARSFGLLPVRSREQAERLATGDLADVELVDAPRVRSNAHQRRLGARQARLDGRASRLAARAAVAAGLAAAASSDDDA